MNPASIFNRSRVYYDVGCEKGLICVESIFMDISRDINIKHIINTFIEDNEIFHTLMYTASKLLKIDKNDMVMYCYYHKLKYGWCAHPILMKSILRHIESLISKTMIATELGSVFKMITFDQVKQCTLLSLVTNVPYPSLIKNFNGKHMYDHYTNEYESKMVEQEYKCEGILNKKDVFNDDELIFECTKVITMQILIILLPRQICDIIESYIEPCT